jgi:hypothetical protein
MCHDFLNDTSFFDLLQCMDDELARETQAAGCPHCDGSLHRACYPRKPRGVARAVLGPAYHWRWSFCCSRDGCRRRRTPASVRFLGRRIYLGVVVVLVSALNGDIGSARMAWLRQYLPLSAKTLRRWRQWWQADFVATRFWRDARARLASPVAPATLPKGLLAQFAGPLSDAVRSLLRFIAPVTTRPGSALIEC